MRQETCPHLQCPQIRTTVKNHTPRNCQVTPNGQASPSRPAGLGSLSPRGPGGGGADGGASLSSVSRAPPSPHPTATLLSQKQVTRGAHFALNPSSAIVGCVAFSRWQRSLSCLFNLPHLPRTGARGPAEKPCIVSPQ